jgi:hypothetical protein
MIFYSSVPPHLIIYFFFALDTTPTHIRVIHASHTQHTSSKNSFHTFCHASEYQLYEAIPELLSTDPLKEISEGSQLIASKQY